MGVSRLIEGCRESFHDERGPFRPLRRLEPRRRTRAVTPAGAVLDHPVRVPPCSARLDGMAKSRGRRKPGGGKKSVRRSPHPLRLPDRVLREARTQRLEDRNVLAVEAWASGCLGEAWLAVGMMEREPEQTLCLEVVGRASTTPSPHGLAAVAALERVGPPDSRSLLGETVEILAGSQPLPAWHAASPHRPVSHGFLPSSPQSMRTRPPFARPSTTRRRGVRPSRSRPPSPRGASTSPAAMPSTQPCAPSTPNGSTSNSPVGPGRPASDTCPRQTRAALAGGGSRRTAET